MIFSTPPPTRVKMKPNEEISHSFFLSLEVKRKEIETKLSKPETKQVPIFFAQKLTQNCFGFTMKRTKISKLANPN